MLNPKQEITRLRKCLQSKNINMRRLVQTDQMIKDMYTRNTNKYNLKNYKYEEEAGGREKEIRGEENIRRSTE